MEIIMKTVTLTDDQITVIRRSLKSSLKYADSEYINEVDDILTRLRIARIQHIEKVGNKEGGQYD